MNVRNNGNNAEDSPVTWEGDNLTSVAGLVRLGDMSGFRNAAQLDSGLRPVLI